MSSMLAPEGKRLARWAAAHEIGVIPVGREVTSTHVFLDDLPIPDVPHPGFTVTP